MLAYTRTGSIKQPPLLFLHGFLGCKEDWENVISPLSSTFCCYAFDLPGHGVSPFSEDVSAAFFHTLDHLHLAEAPLVGCSLGGRPALAFDAKAQGRFSSLIIASGHPGLDTEEQKAKRAREEAVWMERFQTLPLETCIALWYAQPLFATLPLDEALLQRRLRQNREALLFYLTKFPLSLQTKRIPKKAFFLYGQHDLTYKALYTSLQGIPIPGAGHAIHLEAPLALAHKIKNLII
jgi:Predicted hydrolases or acyltransferases (alpha/beta hydrolase superfamily)